MVGGAKQYELRRISPCRNFFGLPIFPGFFTPWLVEFRLQKHNLWRFSVFLRGLPACVLSQWCWLIRRTATTGLSRQRGIFFNVIYQFKYLENMKKYAFLIVAAIIIVAASAFVIASQSTAESETSYWFLMDESGTSVTTTQLSDPDTHCPSQILEPDCARLYSESQTEIINGVRSVKASEVDNYIDFRSKDQ